MSTEEKKLNVRDFPEMLHETYVTMSSCRPYIAMASFPQLDLRAGGPSSSCLLAAGLEISRRKGVAYINE